MFFRRKKQPPLPASTTEASEPVLPGGQAAKSDTTADSIEPKTLDDLILVGTYHLEIGPRQFADWSKLMVQDAGEGVRPHLRSVYSLAVDRLVRCMIEKRDQLAYEVKILRRRLEQADKDLITSISGTAIAAARGATVPIQKVAPDQSWQKLSPDARQTVLEKARAYLEGTTTQPVPH